jgi:hypothetical protein
MTVAEKSAWTCDLCGHAEEVTVTRENGGWPPGWRRFKLTEYGPNRHFSADVGTYDICSKCVVPYKTMAPIRRLLGKLGFFRRD